MANVKAKKENSYIRWCIWSALRMLQEQPNLSRKQARNVTFSKAPMHICKRFCDRPENQISMSSPPSNLEC